MRAAAAVILHAIAARARTARRCEYYVDGRCCTSENSQGPAKLLDAPTEVARATQSEHGYVVDLRVRPRWRLTPETPWRALAEADLVENHGRLIHVFVAASDLGRAWHAHATWDGDGFYARGIPISRAGRFTALASFVVDGGKLKICVAEASIHAHPNRKSILALAATETPFAAGDAPAPAPERPWDIAPTRRVVPAPFSAASELRRECRSTRDALPACPRGDVTVTLEAMTSDANPYATRSSLLALPAPGCGMLRWKVANASLAPYLGVGAHVLVARLGGAAHHAHATTPRYFPRTPCADGANHFDGAALPEWLGNVVAGAVAFPVPGIYLVAAFLNTTSGAALAALHTLFVGAACGDGAAASAACAGGWRAAPPACSNVTT